MDAYLTALNQLVPSPSRYATYLRLLFDGVVIAGRSVLDVGGGSGLISFYAATSGASSVVCLDPVGDGSNPAMERQYELLETGVGGPVVRVRQRFQDLDPLEGRFDIVLIHNAVNHLDEDACERLPAADARQAYTAIFSNLRSLLAPGGHLIMADCGRKNIWSDLRLPNVFAPGIEWNIHQQPEIWNELLLSSGFGVGRIRWDAPSKLRRTGQIVLGNRVGGYLTNSHFVLTCPRSPEKSRLRSR
jgi:SAM-dependent methyltransferase